MTDLLFQPPSHPTLEIAGSSALYPVLRIFCVGRNYAAHAAEMGAEVDRSAPFYFTKSVRHLVASPARMPYPPGTADYHFEMELALAIGTEAFRADLAEAERAILAYGPALDMTRRDLQAKAKDKRRPWDVAKDVEASAVLGRFTPAADLGPVGPQRIWLDVNGERRQDATLADMVHSPAEIVADLSKFYHLAPGDVILTGTPAGVGAVSPGDAIRGGVEGLSEVALTLGPPD